MHTNDQSPRNEPSDTIGEESLYGAAAMLSRRRLLHVGALGAAATLGGAALASAAGAASKTKTKTKKKTTTSKTTTTNAATNSTVATSSSCAVIPDETGGPYPGDGSNGPNFLTQDGAVRTDIRSSIGSSKTVATGVPLIVKLQIVKAASGCKPIANAAVYLWHADLVGRYSMYSQGITNENYLRGIAEADANGNITMQTVVPGCYDGRYPHIHFEVYAGVANAKAGSPILKTSQLAIPASACKLVYATKGYEASVSNFSKVSLVSDNVFGDDAGIHQIPTVTGDVTNGFTATIVVPV